MKFLLSFLLTSVIANAAPPVGAKPTAVPVKATAPRSIVFNQQGGATLKSLSTRDFGTLVPASTLKVWQPEENRNVTYQGYDTVALLDKIYGAYWRQAELVLFICADGYRSPIPTQALLANKTLLAVSKVGEPFTLDNKLEHKSGIQLAPLYLVWNNIKSTALRAEGANHWPYQIVGMELAKFSDKYPYLIPAKTAPAAAQRGFQYFQNYCMTCHQIAGQGGQVGPDLSHVASSAKLRPILMKWIDNPAKIRKLSPMPPLTQTLPNRPQIISDLVSYLEQMHLQMQPKKNKAQ